MRPENVIDALGALDEEMIAPAAADMLNDGRKRVPKPFKLFAIAAAAVLATVLLLIAGLNIGGPRTPVAHPEVTAETETETEDRRQDPVIKPGDSRPGGADTADKEYGSDKTGGKTEPVTGQPEQTPTEPGYTEPVPAKEPVYSETEPSDPPVEIDGITSDDFYVMLYTETGHAFNGPATDTKARAREARDWYFTALGMEESSSPTPMAGDFDPRIKKTDVASLIYRIARELDVPLPAVREWTWFDDFADGEWYSDAVFAVYRAGVLDAAYEHHFGTNDLITAEEAESAVRLFVEAVRSSGTEKAKVLFEN